jgi:hypothetical protein
MRAWPSRVGANRESASEKRLSEFIDNVTANFITTKGGRWSDGGAQILRVNSVFIFSCSIARATIEPEVPRQPACTAANAPLSRHRAGPERNRQSSREHDFRSVTDQRVAVLIVA